VWDHIWLLGGWACGGVVLLGCAVVAVVRRRVPGPGLALGVGGLVFLLGYVGFWGAWNAAELWGGIRYIGPFYVVPVLLPLVHLGARGLADLARARPWATALTGAGMTGLTCFVLVGAVQANITLTGHGRDLVSMIDALPGRPLVFVEVEPPYLMHPASMTANPPDLDGRVLYAVARGRDDMTVVADHPDRPPYLLRLPIGYNRSLASPAATRLERLLLTTGRRVVVTLTVDPLPAGARSAHVAVTAGGRRVSYRVDPRHRTSATITLDADGAHVTGLDAIQTRTVPRGADGSVTFGLFATSAKGGRDRFLDNQTLAVSRDTDGRITVLTPAGQVAAGGEGPPPGIHLDLAAAGSTR
jgi:hypothetical protein